MQELSRSIAVALVATLLIVGFINPVSAAGSVTTAGDAILHSDQVRSTWGYT
jgi:cysteine sulfinate desulfinase/cysteine desulfurase-like protein